MKKTRDEVSRILSARKSACSNVVPVAASAAAASSATSSARCRCAQGSTPRRSSWRASALAASRCQPENTEGISSLSGSTAIGAGVRVELNAPTATRTRSSSGCCHGVCGAVPSMSSKTRATQSPSSYKSRNRGAGTDAGSAAAMRASRRCIPGESGLVLPLTALTKTRRPSVNVSRAATPGENPPGCVAASTTSAPSRSTRPRRT